MNVYQRRQIVRVNLGKVGTKEIVGHEQGESRRCVIIQILDYSELAVIVPLTGTERKMIYSIVKIPKEVDGLTKDSYALCHQIRTVSYDRITDILGFMPQVEFNQILEVLSDFLDV